MVLLAMKRWATMQQKLECVVHANAYMHSCTAAKASGDALLSSSFGGRCFCSSIGTISCCTKAVQHDLVLAETASSGSSLLGTKIGKRLETQGHCQWHHVKGILKVALCSWPACFGQRSLCDAGFPGVT